MGKTPQILSISVLPKMISVFFFIKRLFFVRYVVVYLTDSFFHTFFFCINTQNIKFSILISACAHTVHTLLSPNSFIAKILFLNFLFQILETLELCFKPTEMDLMFVVPSLFVYNQRLAKVQRTPKPSSTTHPLFKKSFSPFGDYIYGK